MENCNGKYRKLWLEFSEIQCANDMDDNKYVVDRFAIWIISGNEEDVWS